VHAPAEVLDELVACLDSPDLAALQWSEEFAVVQARMPPALAASLAALVREHEAELAAYRGAALQLALLQPTFPAEELLGTMRAALAVREPGAARAALRCAAPPPPPHCSTAALPLLLALGTHSRCPLSLTPEASRLPASRPAD